MRINVFALSFLLLSGCSVFGIPTTELYAGRFDSVEDFIASNFKPTLNILLDQDSDELRSTAIIWRAHFNSSMPSYISKPVKDIKTYCSSKGGKLDKVDFEYVGMVRPLLREGSPLTAYFENGAKALESGGSKSDADAVAWLAFKEMLRARAYDGFVHISQEKIMAAAHAGELGAFACEVEGKRKWIAVIDVVSVVAAVGNNSALTPVANIRIKGSSNIL